MEEIKELESRYAELTKLLKEHREEYFLLQDKFGDHPDHLAPKLELLNGALITVKSETLDVSYRLNELKRDLEEKRKKGWFSFRRNSRVA